MGTLSITNDSSDPIFLRDFYYELAAGATLERTVSYADYQGMAQLHEGVADTALTVTFTPSAEELAAGVGTPETTVEPQDLEVGATTDLNSVCGVFVKTFAALVTGTADDVTVYAVNTLPYKVEILYGFIRVSAGVAGATLAVRSAAAGGGTHVGTADGENVGFNPLESVNAPVTLTPGGSVGLFIRRSDRAVAGTMILHYRRVA